MNKGRLEAFSDGVYAILITLLILDLRPPHGTAAQLSAGLHALASPFLAYLLSFAIVGVYWVAHHGFLGLIERVDRPLLWLNLLMLLLVSVLPIPTSLLGQHPRTPLAIALYGLNLACLNLAGCALWGYATHQRRLVSARLPEKTIRRVLVVHGAPVLVYLFAVAIGPLAPSVSLALFVAVPLFFIVPNPLVAAASAPRSRVAGD